MSDQVRRFYDELAEEYEAIFLDWDASVRGQGELIDRLLADTRGPVLDVAAGMGTQAIGLALRGRSVVARDLSPALVERGRREAARLGARLEFAVGDLREARPADAAAYGAVIAFDNPLPHLLEDQDLRAALHAVARALAPGGRFLTSTRDYDALAGERPALDPPRLLGVAPARRLITQVWTWADDGCSYALDHLIVRESERGWVARTRTVRYRALRRDELDQAAAAAGLIDGRWLLPEESGFYQPIFTARRPP